MPGKALNSGKFELRSLGNRPGKAHAHLDIVDPGTRLSHVDIHHDTQPAVLRLQSGEKSLDLRKVIDYDRQSGRTIELRHAGEFRCPHCRRRYQQPANAGSRECFRLRDGGTCDSHCTGPNLQHRDVVRFMGLGVGPQRYGGLPRGGSHALDVEFQRLAVED